jgi:gamma-glutamylcyclotransferase
MSHNEYFTSRDFLTPLGSNSASSSRSASPAPTTRRTGYVNFFAYGTNLWHAQIKQRCPSAEVYGIGRIRHWSFQINDRGHPNITPCLPVSDISPTVAKWLEQLGGATPMTNIQRVYGVIYQMTEADEAKLDEFQEHPATYSKESKVIECWAAPLDGSKHITITEGFRRCRVFFYVDRSNTSKSTGSCSPEVAYKLQQGILDALDLGIPAKYIDGCVRPYLPGAASTAAAIKNALAYAIQAGVPVRQLVDEIEKELIASGPTKKAETSTWEFEEIIRGFSPAPSTQAQTDTGAAASFQNSKTSI